MEDNYKTFGIKSWAEEDRPREKLLLKGKHSLSDAELIAILIASGNDKESAVDLSKRILDSVGNNLNELGKLSVNDLKKFKGIGEAKAISIIAALELGRRRQASDIIKRNKIIAAKDVYDFAMPYLADLSYEAFFVIYCNRANDIISHQITSTGGMSGTVVDIRIILKEAIERLASVIFIAHNHPSGSLVPSSPDLQMTKKLKDAAKLMDIYVADHVIVGNGDYYSLANNNQMDG